MSAAPADGDRGSSSPTSQAPEEVVQDLARRWEHHDQGLDHLLDRVCGRLASEANHELRQILTLLATELELANLRSEGDEVTLEAETLERLLDAVQRGKHVASRYLSRPDVAQLLVQLDREPVQLASLARGILAQEGLDPEGAFVAVDLEPAAVEADREKIERVLGHLVSRFWRARPAKGRFGLRVEEAEDAVRGFVGLEPAPMSRGDLAEELENHLDMQAMGIDIPYARAVFERHGGALYVDRWDEALGYGFELPNDAPEPEVLPR